MSKATEIYYTECCALCRNFEEGMLGCLYSVCGSCFLQKKNVWSHEYCRQFELSEISVSEFKLEAE